VDTSFRDFFDRYGPTLAMILAVVLLVVLMPSNHNGGSSVNASDSGSVQAGSNGQSVTGANGSAAATPGDATSGGAAGATQSGGGTSTAAGGATQGSGGQTAVQGQTGKYKCRPDGRQSGISAYMPPCHQYDGNNGGATARGVTASSIKIA
jgi:hypothetical protein